MKRLSIALADMLTFKHGTLEYRWLELAYGILAWVALITFFAGLLYGINN